MKVLLPIIQSMVKDELAEVRNNILSRIDILAQVIGNDATVEKLLPTLLELSKDAKWYTRGSVLLGCSCRAWSISDCVEIRK